ncbi:response regulator transcription factor [Caballeronia sp. BR00000012568055]|uniref:response regulator transcription factor n=1 Tax=Caballeronia sp. BR00000012568055 TaxID=2918761 RepID=UPI0023F805D8|nr:response regulator transcription factor [Caballeronia sp. BR00000012568055]
MNKNVRVAILDDHPLILCGLRKMLEAEGFDIVGAESSPAGLRHLLEGAKCDVVIADYFMSGDELVGGWRFLAAISSDYPALPVLVYSDSEDPFLLGSLAQRGVAGIVSKREEMGEVINALNALASRGLYRSPVTLDAIQRFSSQPELRRFAGLTRRQMEVAGLMLCGLNVRDTARLLRRRVNTISAQRSEACKRLGFSGESEMYRFAFGHDLWLDRSAWETRSAAH